MHQLLIDDRLIDDDRVSSEGVLPVFGLTIESQSMCEC